VMWRLQYRNSGGQEKLVGNHSTDVNGANRAGVRWWELRRSGGAWALEQEGTYAPNGDSDSRWMGSVSSDASGNIAVGYSVGSSSLAAGIRYTGRLSGDPPGVLTQAETTVQGGGGSQNFERWGDYSAMTVDPSDGCTFWYTNEYALGSGVWSTRVASFKFDTCGEPGFTLSGSNLVQSVCSTSLGPIPLSLNSVGGFADPVTLSFVGLPVGYAGSFSTNPVTPAGSSTAAVVLDLGQVTGGLADFLIQASAMGVPDQSVAVDVTFFGSVPAIPQLSSPPNGFTTLTNTPTLTWGFDGAVAEYVLEVDDDPGFGSIDYTAMVGFATSHSVASTLNPGTTYAWRVSASNACGAAASASTVFQFTTPETACQTPGLSIPDAIGIAIGSVTDTMVIGSGDPITGLETSVEIAHTYVGDLSVTLEHVDTGTSVLLVNRPGEPALGTFGCQRANMDVILSDLGNGLVEDQCEVTSPAISGIRIPNNPLAAFSGESITGTWELTVSDAAEADTGTLDEWCLLVVPEPGSATMLGSGILLLWLERRMRGRRSRSAR
ncbi:MAG: proprotein convertase P-domain-containing protein, partial [Myxococcota bacterium]